LFPYNKWLDLFRGYVIMVVQVKKDFYIMQIEKSEMFEYLDTLRESGVTNMFGAGQYLEQAFDIDRREAKTVLLEWMNQYSPQS
jgi:hypothetical protein